MPSASINVIEPQDPISDAAVADTVELPAVLDTRKVFARGVYFGSRVDLLVSKYAQVRSDLVASCAGALQPSTATYARRVADYLVQAKDELEGSHPKLAVAASLLSNADGSLIWLYPPSILVQRANIVQAKLRESNPRPDALVGNLKSANEQLAQHPSFQHQDSLRSALEDALRFIHDVDREGLMEEDLQARRVHVLFYYMIGALSLLLLAVGATMRPILNATGDQIWPVTWPSWISDKSILTPVAMVTAALGLAALGAAAAMLSGMLNIRDSRARLASYRISLLNLRLKPLVGAVAAVALYVVLSSNVIQGLEITNGGVLYLSAFLAGFSERYFLRIVGLAERNGGASDHNRVAESRHASVPDSVATTNVD